MSTQAYPRCLCSKERIRLSLSPIPLLGQVVFPCFQRVDSIFSMPDIFMCIQIPYCNRPRGSIIDELQGKCYCGLGQDPIVWCSKIQILSAPSMNCLRHHRRTVGVKVSGAGSEEGHAIYTADTRSHTDWDMQEWLLCVSWCVSLAVKDTFTLHFKESCLHTLTLTVLLMFR